MAERLGALLEEFRTVTKRFGPVEEDALIDRVLSSVASRHTRLEMIRRQIAELDAEARWLEEEISGRQQSLALLLTDAIRRIGRQVQDAWSPIPVLGYRIWTMERRGLRGARVTWRVPTMHAECLKTGAVTGVPHADGRCGRLGCGVYATKELLPLIGSHLKPQSHGFVVGLVALSGRVVEHELGYRAQHAEIVALAAVDVHAYLTTSEPDLIAGVCDSPEEAVTLWGELRPTDVLGRIERYLAAEVRRRGEAAFGSAADS